MYKLMNKKKYDIFRHIKKNNLEIRSIILKAKKLF